MLHLHATTRRHDNDDIRRWAMSLKQMALEAGLQDKPMYSVAEIEKATGISR